MSLKKHAGFPSVVGQHVTAGSVPGNQCPIDVDVLEQFLRKKHPMVIQCMIEHVDSSAQNF